MNNNQKNIIRIRFLEHQIKTGFNFTEWLGGEYMLDDINIDWSDNDLVDFPIEALFHYLFRLLFQRSYKRFISTLGYWKTVNFIYSTLNNQ